MNSSIIVNKESHCTDFVILSFWGQTLLKKKKIGFSFGHVCRTKNEVSVTESSYLLLQLWHLHLVPCKRCKHTCIPRNHLPVVLQFCNKDKTQLYYTYLITSMLVNTHIWYSYLGLFQFICGDYFGVLLWNLERVYKAMREREKNWHDTVLLRNSSSGFCREGHHRHFSLIFRVLLM